MIRKILVIAFGFGLSGCYSIQGSERVLNNQGRITAAVDRDSIFSSDFDKAYKSRLAGTPVTGQVTAMMSSGFTHIYSFCDGYFDSMGTAQRKSRIARDTLAPISALMTGVLALHSFDKNTKKKENLLAVLGLATGATASILDIYDEHMLFGAENIGGVEQLTKAALASHSAQVLSKPDVSFDAATRHLLDNQAICSPQHILTLTREAIRAGTVVARPVALSAGSTAKEGDRRVEVSVDTNK